MKDITIDDITTADIEKAEQYKNSIRAFVASFPMGRGITLTHQFAIWHLKQVEDLNNQIENMRNEIVAQPQNTFNTP